MRANFALKSGRDEWTRTSPLYQGSVLLQDIANCKIAIHSINTEV